LRQTTYWLIERGKHVMNSRKEIIKRTQVLVINTARALHQTIVFWWRNRIWIKYGKILFIMSITIAQKTLQNHLNFFQVWHIFVFFVTIASFPAWEKRETVNTCMWFNKLQAIKINFSKPGLTANYYITENWWKVLGFWKGSSKGYKCL